MSAEGGGQQHPHGCGAGGHPVGAGATTRSDGALSHRVPEADPLPPPTSPEHAPSAEQDGAQS